MVRMEWLLPILLRKMEPEMVEATAEGWTLTEREREREIGERGRER